MPQPDRVTEVTSDRVARLSATHSVELDPAAACRRLEAPDWLGTVVESSRFDRHRYLTDLAFPVSQGSRTLLFRKATYVDLRRAPSRVAAKSRSNGVRPASRRSFPYSRGCSGSTRPGFR